MISAELNFEVLKLLSGAIDDFFFFANDDIHSPEIEKNTNCARAPYITAHLKLKRTAEAKSTRTNLNIFITGKWDFHTLRLSTWHLK